MNLGGFTEVTKRDSWQCGTSHAATHEDDVSLAGVLHDAFGCAVCCMFAGFLSRDAVFQICQRPMDAVFAAVQIGS